MNLTMHEKRVRAGKKAMLNRGFKLWTDSEDKRLIEMYLGGTPFVEIVESLGRSRGAISTRVYELNLTPRRTRRFTSSDDVYIRRFYGVKTVTEMAEFLNRTCRSIRSRASVLGLGGRRCFGSNHHRSTLSDHDVELVRQLHDEGVSLRSIAEKMEISSSYVFNLVHFKARPQLTFNEMH